MTTIMKCDRCETPFDTFEILDENPVNCATVAYRTPYRIGKWEDVSKIDLCPSCMAELLDNFFGRVTPDPEEPEEPGTDDTEGSGDGDSTDDGTNSEG